MNNLSLFLLLATAVVGSRGARAEDAASLTPLPLPQLSPPALLEPLAEPKPGTDMPMSAATSTPNAVPSPSPGPTLTPEQVKTLRAEFDRALRGEVQALAHRQELERKQLETALQVRTREQDQKRTRDRDEFFRAHRDPISRRKFTDQEAQAKKVFQAEIDGERKRRGEAWGESRKKLESEQGARKRTFEESIARGERPGPELWNRGW